VEPESTLVEPVVRAVEPVPTLIAPAVEPADADENSTDLLAGLGFDARNR